MRTDSPYTGSPQKQKEAYEVRMATLDRGEALDELIVPGLVHFESMADDALWCGLTLPDGRGLMVNIWAERKGGKVRLGWRVSEDWPGGKEYSDGD
jgi:hypothetical protein